MFYINKYNNLITGLLSIMSLCGTAYNTAAAAPNEAFGAEPAAIMEMLQSGGYVVYLRHAETDRSRSDGHPRNLDDCSTQRNLSEAGRAQALAIGEAIRTLEIPIGKVITSPYCRCKDTARLAFGRHEVSHDLRFGLGEDAVRTRQLSRALKEMLSTRPPDDTNTVLISHTANLKEATGLWPKPEGSAYIFKPLEGKEFEFVGKLTPGDWPRMSAVHSSNTSVFDDRADMTRTR